MTQLTFPEAERLPDSLAANKQRVSLKLRELVRICPQLSGCKSLAQACWMGLPLLSTWPVLNHFLGIPKNNHLLRMAQTPIKSRAQLFCMDRTSSGTFTPRWLKNFFLIFWFVCFAFTSCKLFFNLGASK